LILVTLSSFRPDPQEPGIVDRPGVDFVLEPNESVLYSPTRVSQVSRFPTIPAANVLSCSMVSKVRML